METIYLNDGNDGIPERFDYGTIQEKTGVYNNVKNEWVYVSKIEVYHVSGYRYQDRVYMGTFNSIKELTDFVRTANFF